MSVLVSICIPIFNVESFIGRCARSLFEQSYGNLEFIFINDCTPDNSIAILKRVIDDYPERKPHVRIINHNENKGLAAARNTGVSECSGDFVLHVDSDDYIDRETVSLLVGEQEKGDYDIVSSDLLDHYEFYTETDNQPKYKSSKDMTVKLLDKSARGCVVARLIRRSLYIDNEVRAIEGLNLGEDSLVIPQLAYFAKKVSNVSSPLYHYVRINENSFTSSFSEFTAEQTWHVYEELESIFEKRGVVYMNAICRAKVRLLVGNVISCIRLGGPRSYCEILLKRLKLYKSEYNVLPLPYRVICYTDNLFFLKIYISFSYLVRHFFLFVKDFFSK